MLNNMQKNAYFINPFSLYAISWILVIIVYSFEWSYLYPNLKLSSLFFLIVTICISIYYSKKEYKKFCLKPLNNNKYLPVIKKYCILLYILLIIEFIIYGIPFLAYNAYIGADDSLYKNWGIPVIKVIVINGFSVLFLLSVSVYFLSNQYNKKKVRLYLLLSILPPILCMQRGVALNMIVGAFCIYMMQTKKLKRSLLITFSLGIFILYGFGVMGQKRMNGKENLILKIGEPTNEFDKSNIPQEFFWSYLYISSPLANLQFEINTKKSINTPDTSFLSFIGLNIIPETLSKHFFKTPDLSQYRVTPALAVGSTYYLPFYQLGWIGMWLMFIYIIFFIKLCRHLVNQNSPFYPSLIAVLCEVSFFGIFDNMTAYAAMYPQLILIYLGAKYLFR